MVSTVYLTWKLLRYARRSPAQPEDGDVDDGAGESLTEPAASPAAQAAREPAADRATAPRVPVAETPPALFQTARLSARPVRLRFTRITAGIDLGSHTCKLVQVAHLGDGPVVVGFSEVQTSARALLEGSVQDPAGVARALRALTEAGHPVRVRRAVTALASEVVILRHAQFPRMSERELKEVLKWQGDQYLPLPLERASLDFAVVDPGIPGGQMEVLLVASRREAPEAVGETLRRARVQPVAVEVDAFAAYRALCTAGHIVEEVKDQALVLVDLGASACRVSVFRREVPQLVRSVALGGHQLTAAVAAELGLSFEEAEQQKCLHGLRLDSPVRAALLPLVDRLLAELRRSLEFFLSHSRKTSVGAVFLYGGGADLPGLVDAVQDYLRVSFHGRFDGSPEIPIVVGNGGSGIAIDRRLARCAQDFGPRYLTALGLALRR